MKYVLFLIALGYSCIHPLRSQDKAAIKYAETITAEDLKERLTVLAADSMEGRETGERGQKMAAHYLADQFKEVGLLPPINTKEASSYFQQFLLQKVTYQEVYLKKREEKKENLKDFLYFSRSGTGAETPIAVTYVGDIETLDLAGIETKGRFVAFTASEMSGWRDKLEQIETAEVEGYVILLKNSRQLSFAIDRFGQILTKSKMTFSAEPVGTKTILGGADLAEWIFDRPFEELKNEGVGQTDTLVLHAAIEHREISSENVLGYLEGRERPEEVLVITAHYDHVGIIGGEIYNGADDDGSGTTTLLELAEAFAIAAQKGDHPKRSILFLAVAGEEKGLLGSEYYTENPVFPLENTVTNLNIDMIGRVDPKHKENPFYVYLIGSDKLSQDLHELSEKINRKTTGLELDYTYNDENDPNQFFYRSDHYNFAKKEIPVIFYFSGTHEDYHQPTDTIDKIHFDKMKRIAELIFYTAWEIANREERIHPD